jgi:hypothetical protein
LTEGETFHPRPAGSGTLRASFIGSALAALVAVGPARGEEAPAREKLGGKKAPERVPTREEQKRASPTVEEPAPAQSATTPALAVTVSGGVSLGSFEAGQLHFLTEALRLAEARVPLLVGAGASAGSANSLIALTEACQEGTIAPEDSLGYRIWTNVGIDQLFDPRKVGSRELFHQGALKQGIATIEETWKTLPASCEFVFGATVTRIESRSVELGEGVTVSRETEHFKLRFKRGAGALPRMTNFVDPGREPSQPLLALGVARELSPVAEVLVASAAFPIAFPPQEVSYCFAADLPDSSGTPTSPSCGTRVRKDLFVDGGILDNDPLSLAHDLAMQGLFVDAGGRVRLRSTPAASVTPAEFAASGIDLKYLFINPALTRYPDIPAPAHEDRRKEPILNAVVSLGGEVLSAARAEQVARLAKAHPEVFESLWAIRGNAPPIGDLLGAFLGFFEKDFRDFDFHLGTYDAFVELDSARAHSLQVNDLSTHLTRSFLDPAARVHWRHRKLACLAAHLEPMRFSHLQTECLSDDLRNFRILLQVSLDRLWSRCRDEQVPAAETKGHPLCAQARAGARPPRVDPELPGPEPRYRETSESEFDYALRLLGVYQFEFRDLGLETRQASRARVEIRRRLVDMVEALAHAQPGVGHRTVVQAAGRTAVNTLTYEPPEQRAYVTFGGSLATGYLGRVGRLSAWYVNPDMRLRRVQGYWTGRPQDVSAALTVGFELSLLPLAGQFAQPSLGLRFGYQITGNDEAGLTTCEESATSGDSRECSQPVFHLPLNVTLLEKVRLNATAHFFPFREEFNHSWFDLELGLGVELF